MRGALRDLEAGGFVAMSDATGPTNPSASLGAFAIDWAALDRRRRADLAKLEAVQKYAYATTCRRAFVLRYFGDPALKDARSCGGCDNCLGTKRVLEKEAPRRKAKPQRADVPVVGPADAPLFEALRVLRSEIARRERVPSYCVLADKTLAEMAVRRPRSPDALLEVRGIGPEKLKKYGEQFLTLISGTR